MGHKKSSRASKRSAPKPITQNSAFLNLPGELRNSIYELIVKDTASMSVSHNRTAYNPPLSLVFRQIRREYKDIYISEAPEYAATVNVHITNFIWNTNSVDIRTLLACFPLPARSTLRTYKLRIFLTNNCDSYRHQRDSLVSE